MSQTVDCYFTPISPWAYLGMARFRRIVAETGAVAAFKPVDIMQVFARVGALPLGQRPQSKQDNRLQELVRWRDYLKMPLILQPQFFPTNPIPACRLISAVASLGLDAAALSEACLKACWVEEQDIASADTLIQLTDRCGLDGRGLYQASLLDAALQQVQANTDEALARGVIGSPCYLVDDQVFFGQDRLDFVARALLTG
ncbi:MAG: 2-hydroxychromene-2-carboxylate isomerase [Motiliproteus sp.]